MNQKNYEKIINDLYVGEVSNLETLESVAKLVGISYYQLKKFVVREGYEIEKMLSSIFNQVFKYNLLDDFYVEYLGQIENIEYVASVINYSCPNLKNDPVRFVEALVALGFGKIKEVDDLEIVPKEDDVLDSNSLTLIKYVCSFSSDYGISSKKMYSYMVDVKKKNKLSLNKIISCIKKIKFNTKKGESEDVSYLENVDNLDYKFSVLSYSYPNVLQNYDSFVETITRMDTNDVEKMEHAKISSELEDFLREKSQNLVKKTM